MMILYIILLTAIRRTGMNTVDPISMILAALTLTAFCYYIALDYAEGLYALHTCKVKVDELIVSRH